MIGQYTIRKKFLKVYPCHFSPIWVWPVRLPWKNLGPRTDDTTQHSSFGCTCMFMFRRQIPMSRSGQTSLSWVRTFLAHLGRVLSWSWWDSSPSVVRSPSVVVRQHPWPVVSAQYALRSQSFLICSMPLVYVCVGGVRGVGGEREWNWWHKLFMEIQ